MKSALTGGAQAALTTRRATKYIESVVSDPRVVTVPAERDMWATQVAWAIVHGAMAYRDKSTLDRARIACSLLRKGRFRRPAGFPGCDMLPPWREILKTAGKGQALWQGGDAAGEGQDTPKLAQPGQAGGAEGAATLASRAHVHTRTRELANYAQLSKPRKRPSATSYITETRDEEGLNMGVIGAARAGSGTRKAGAWGRGWIGSCV